ncbi:MAG: hypothetical protein ACOVOQ_05310 [Flavobacterium sp.]
MAKQEGIIQLKGTIGNITFAKTTSGYVARKKTTLDGSRIAADPVFVRTRENNSEFGNAGKAGRVLRTAIRLLLQNNKDGKVTSRLTKEMMKVIKADATSTRGKRNVVDGEAELLEGFDFNSNASLSNTLYIPHTATIDRASGVLNIAIDSFVAEKDIVAPAGTTHFKLVSAGSEIDFEKETFTTDYKASAILPLNSDTVATQTLLHNVTPNSTHPLFLLLGIQFFQQVNGVDYPLKNGAFNALRVVKVAGV